MRCEMCIFPHADQTTQRLFTLQTLLESRVGLDLRWEVGRVPDEILGDHLHLNLT